MNFLQDHQTNIDQKTKSNQKRLQSLQWAKKEHNKRKTILKTALLSIDKTSKKIIFDDNVINKDTTAKVNNTNKRQTSTKTLFEDESDDNYEVDFTVKKQFEGEEGQKLLALQSQYKNDKRFNLDERFLSSPVEGNQNDNGFTEDGSDYEMSLEQEKKKEFEILEQVLGKQNLKPKLKPVPKGEKKLMIRFDPTQPQHSKYEIKKDDIQLKKDKKDKTKKLPEIILEEKKSEVTEAPEVSKDVFYQVKGNLKDSLHENKQVSLLSMFGNVEANGTDEIEEEIEKQTGSAISRSDFKNDSNPFKYDSSDDEEEMETSNKEQHYVESREITNDRNNFWVETFFFKEDDYRLQEGFDFIEKIKMEDNSEFAKARRELKEIVKIKVRNVQQKKKPFKRKLGGNKRRKNIRLKKAFKK